MSVVGGQGQLDGGLDREPPVLPRIRPVPRWIAPLFAGLAAVTVPWTVYLAATLPHVIRARHYRIAWVGFDMGLVVLLLLTSVLAYRGQRHMVMTATATATALVIDAWFDVLTSPNGRELAVAIATALIGELPLAALCLWIALQVDRVIARRLQQLARRAERGSRWRSPYRRR